MLGSQRHIAGSDTREADSTAVALPADGSTRAAETLQRAIQAHQRGALSDAEASYRRLLATQPLHTDALHLLGLVCMATGRLTEAVGLIEQAIAGHPHIADFHSNLANTLLRLGRAEEALPACQRALALRPAFPEAHCNLGLAYQHLHRLEEAAEAYRQALTLRGDYPDALNNLGNVLKDLGHLDEAETAYRRIIALRPDDWVSTFNLGLLQQTTGRAGDAEATYRRCLALQPTHADSHYNLGHLLRGQGRIEEAALEFRTAIRCDATHTEALGELLQHLCQLCLWDDVSALMDSTLRALRSDEGLFSPFTMLFLDAKPEDHLLCARRWVKRKLPAKTVQGPGPSLAGSSPDGRSRTDRLRIGYLGANSSPTCYLIPELLEFHDRSGFEIFTYSIGRGGDAASERRILVNSDHYVDLSNLPDVDAAGRIAADGIDILVDLKGYTSDSRWQVLSRRPAPIAVNWLGFPATMGAEFVDYILTDPFITPPGHERFFSERICRLPECYEINDRRRAIDDRTPTRAECGLPDDAFVYCSFNQTYKITPQLFSRWLHLLESVPGSVLWLFASNPWAPQNLRQHAKARGVSPERLVFAGMMPLAGHLARYRNADLFLDTFPCVAHTTASDALWAGLPVLTRVGETFASRVAGSLLRAVGLPELVTESAPEYDRMALHLAQDRGLLTSLRERLAAGRLSSPLFDSRRFTRHLETAYRMMWDKWQSGGTPSAIDVPAV